MILKISKIPPVEAADEDPTKAYTKYAAGASEEANEGWRDFRDFEWCPLAIELRTAISEDT